MFFPGFLGLRWGSGTSAQALTDDHWTSLRGRPSLLLWTMKSKGWGERTQQETWTATLSPCCTGSVTIGEDDNEEVKLPSVCKSTTYKMAPDYLASGMVRAFLEATQWCAMLENIYFDQLSIVQKACFFFPRKTISKKDCFSFIFSFSGGLINPSLLWSTKMERMD